MQEIIRNGWENKEFIEKRCNGFEDLKSEVMKPEYSLENVSTVTGVPVEDLKTAAEWYAKSGATAILYSMGITQHTTGVDNVKSCEISRCLPETSDAGNRVNALRGQNNVQGSL